MSWTFGGVAFSWFAPSANGLPTAPEWQRSPNLVERALLDSGEADVTIIGYTARKLGGPIFVATANVGALTALNGTAGLLSDGTTTWTAILELELSPLLVAAEGATGTATFTRPRA